MKAKNVSIFGLHPATVLLFGTALTPLCSPVYAQGTPAQPSAPSPVVTAEPDGGIIKSIDVSGAQRIEPDTVRSYIQLRAGQSYNKAALDQALRDLFATELFADVQIRDNKGALTIEVKENPVINRILFEGNKRLKEDKLTPEIKLAPRQIFTASKVRADVGRIIELYRRQGRYGAQVEPKKVLLDQNRVDIVYEITEGPKSKVRAINIIGAHVFSDATLKAQMATKQSQLKTALSSATTYDPDRLAYDQSKLRQFYLSNGYADFRVISAVAELTPDKRDFVITYVVEEGPRYKFGDITVESEIHDLKPEAFQPLIPNQKGDWYNAKSVEDTVDNMTKQAGVFGYAFADVNPIFKHDTETKTVGIIYKINETPRVYVERIDVNGNTLTQDKVVRREFRLAEGDAFNSFQVKRSSDRIQSLGYFQEKLEIEQKKGSADDRIILQANVEEKATGQLQLSAGYSSLEKLIFSASIAQNNFRGAGQTLRLSGSISTYSKSVELGFTEPYLFNKNIALGVDLFRRDYNSFNYVGTSRNTTYSQASTGFQARLGIPLTEYWSLALRYGFSFEDVSLDQSTYYIGGQCSPLLAGRYLCDAIGNRTISSLGYSLVRDTLDNRLRPHNGTRFIFGQDLAGPGGSVQYLRTTLNFAKYKDLGRGFIGSASFEAGAVIPLKSNASTDPVRLTDRFFLGEPQFAGFDIRGVGPRVLRTYLNQDGAAFTNPGIPSGATVAPDLTFDQNAPQAGNLSYSSPSTSTTFDALGGRYYYKGRLELEIPLGSGAKELGLRPSIFTDIGAVWGVRAPSLINSSSSFFSYTDPNNGTPIPLTYSYSASLGQANGQQIYQVTDAGETYNNASVYGLTTTCRTGYSPNIGSADCSTNVATTSTSGTTLFPATNKFQYNSATRAIPPFTEQFYGDTPRPRLSIGFGVNWNSPFGPFRIDIAKAILKSEGDQTKLFTFNVGTQF